ncbi:hypothetical protein JCM11641_008377 [Rhodosporidiobolus odoratus]
MSLFGGASTSAAPSFSFGSTSTAPASSAPAAPSLFGNTQAAPAATGGGGLFGAKPATPAPAGGGLFGGSAAAPATGGGGLFGQPAAGGATAPKPAFSFGTPAASTSTPASAPSLFGATPAPSSAPTAGGGLFGSTTFTPAPAAGAGLFEAKPATSMGGGLFGSAAAAPAAPSFGAPAAAAPQAAPVGGITKNTKFQDLPDQARNVVEEMDKFIRQQSQLADELKKKDLGSEITQAQRMFEQYAAESATVTSLLTTDARLLSTLRTELEQALSDFNKTTTLIDGFKGGPGGPKAAEAKAVATFPYEYFKGKTEEMEERVGRYRGIMEQITSQLTSSSTLSPSSIPPTLKAQHASLVSLASSISAMDLELKGLKDEYRWIWREKTGRQGGDPFRGNGGSGVGGVGGVERGVGGMAIR